MNETLKSYWIELEDGTLIEIGSEYFPILAAKMQDAQPGLIRWSEGNHSEGDGIVCIFEDECPSTLNGQTRYHRRHI